ncbi:MAG TPA: sugar phosphate nucleotidyltransferase, partial [Limnochordales bacterium]
MAGGQGSRLRPLTCDRPKPMVPVLNEPVMAHLLRLLARVGVEEVIVTLHPMPEMVQERFGDGREFGLRVRYLVEPHPLGTAGSAARALPWLDGTFLVVSGDAFTDIPLQQAVRFHRERGAVATLVLRRVEEPGEYGIVATDPAGRVARFQEKPCRAELFSNQANTGIYVLQPEVLAGLPEGRPVDFSQELFPRLLQEGAALYGWVAREGYWNDVGTPEQYRQTHLDVMARWVEQGAEGVRVGPGCRVAPGAKLVPPCQLGPGCEVEDGAEVGPFACLGPQCHVGRGASVRHSVLWQGCWVGPAAEVRGAVLADGVVLGRAARGFEGAVLGRDCRVEQGGVVGPGVRLWPGKQVEAHERLTRWVVWAGSPLRPAVGPLGVRGLANASLPPELALGLAGAFAGRLAPGTAVVVAHSGQAAARTLAWAAGCGVSAAGCAVLWVDACAAAVARMAVRAAGAGGGVYVAQGGEGGGDGQGGAGREDGECTLMLWDGQGLELAPPELRAVEQAFRLQEWRRSGPEGMGELHSAFALQARAQELYLAALQRWCGRLLEAWDAGGPAGEGAAPAQASRRAAGEGRPRDGEPVVAVEPAGAGPAA